MHWKAVFIVSFSLLFIELFSYLAIFVSSQCKYSIHHFVTRNCIHQVANQVTSVTAFITLLVFQITMAASQKFCLKWNNFQNSVTSVFDNLRQDEELVDITLCCEGKKIKAHRMMLSACSPYFRELFKVSCIFFWLDIACSPYFVELFEMSCS